MQPPGSPAKAWLMVTLCAVMMGLNYADKGILGFAAQPIMRDFKLSPVEFGYLGSSFFLLFAVSGIVLGFLADRWPSKHVMTAMAIGWALCLLPAAGQSASWDFMATRILLGATQGPATGAFKWFPQENRAFSCRIGAPRNHRSNLPVGPDADLDHPHLRLAHGLSRTGHRGCRYGSNLDVARRGRSHCRSHR